MANGRCHPMFLLIMLAPVWLTHAQFWHQCIDQCPAKYFTTTYHIQCIDSCEKHNQDYYWCYTRKGWDYCSPGVNIDSTGNTCRDDYPCAQYGSETKFQCVLAMGHWSDCARVEPRATIHKTKYQKECISECWYYKSDDYFYCSTEDGWDYCSPLPDHTIKNDPCRLGHQCATYGETYSWCYTSFNDDWNYCGSISPGECTFTESFRRKRQPNNARVICTKEDNNRIVTSFIERGSDNIASTNRRQRNEALDLINQWDGQRLTEGSRSNLVTSSNFRIDNQGMCNVNNQRCYNLQVQLNQPRPRGQSTTVAQILVPVGTPEDYIRLGLRESLQRQVKVVVEVTDGAGPSTSRNNNNKCCRRRKN